MFRILLGTLAVVLAAASPAYAQSLYMVSAGDSGLVVAERDSLRWRDGRPQMTYHVIFRTPMAFEKTSGRGYDWVQGMTTRVEFDCATRLFRPIQFSFFDFTQTAIERFDGDQDWATLADGSDLDRVRALSCENVLPSETHFPSLADAAFIFYGVVHEADDGS